MGLKKPDRVLFDPGTRIDELPGSLCCGTCPSGIHKFGEGIDLLKLLIVRTPTDAYEGTLHYLMITINLI